MRNKIIRYLSIIGIILFIIILSQTNINEILKVMINADFKYIIIGFIIANITIPLKALKWKIAVDIFGKKYDYKDSIENILIGNAFGSITPAKSGDLIRTIDLNKKTGMDNTHSFSIVLFDKIIDTLTLLLYVIFSLILLILIFGKINGAMTIIILCAILIISTILILTGKIDPLLKIIYSKFIPTFIKEKVKDVYITFKTTSKNIYKNKTFYLYTLITIITWGILFTATYFFAKSVTKDVSFGLFFIFTPIIIIIEVLPISIMGIGSREAIMIILFSLVGINKEISIAISLIVLIVSIPTIILGFILGWIRKI